MKRSKFAVIVMVLFMLIAEVSSGQDYLFHHLIMPYTLIKSVYKSKNFAYVQFQYKPISKKSNEYILNGTSYNTKGGIIRTFIVGKAKDTIPVRLKNLVLGQFILSKKIMEDQNMLGEEDAYFDPEKYDDNGTKLDYVMYSVHSIVHSPRLISFALNPSPPK